MNLLKLLVKWMIESMGFILGPKDRLVVRMNTFVGIWILATRSFDDEIDGLPIYLEEEFEDDVAASGGESEVHVDTERTQNVQVIRKNFAEIWIWQSSNMRWVLAWYPKAWCSHINNTIMIQVTH